MKIEGLPPDPGGIKKIPEKKPPATVSAETTQSADTVAITGSSISERTAELAQSVPIQLPVRPDVVESAAERLSQNYYDTPEARELTAERLISAPGITQSANTMQIEQPETPERRERLENIQILSLSGHYDQPETIAAVAERLTESLGLSSLFGK